MSKTTKPSKAINSSGREVDDKTLKAAFKLYNKVSEFINWDLKQTDPKKRLGSRSAWLVTSEAKIYVRKASQLTDKSWTMKWVLDIASVDVKPKWQNKGLFTTFLDLVTAVVPYQAVRIESILNPNLEQSLLRKGWKPTVVSTASAPTLYLTQAMRDKQHKKRIKHAVQ